MLHQHIEIEDPDVVQAIDDLRPVALELRERTAAYLQLPAGSNARRAAQTVITDLMSRVSLRAERLCISADTLMLHINDAIDRKARRGKDAPDRITSRTLATRIEQARAREVDAHAGLTRAQSELKAATASRIAAEQAYAGYGARGAQC